MIISAAEHFPVAWCFWMLVLLLEFNLQFFLSWWTKAFLVSRFSFKRWAAFLNTVINLYNHDSGLIYLKPVKKLSKINHGIKRTLMFSWPTDLHVWKNLIYLKNGRNLWLTQGNWLIDTWTLNLLLIKQFNITKCKLKFPLYNLDESTLKSWILFNKRLKMAKQNS